MSNYLLECRNVTKEFRIGGMIFGTRLRALDNVNLTLDKDKPLTPTSVPFDFDNAMERVLAFSDKTVCLGLMPLFKPVDLQEALKNCPPSSSP